MTPDAAAAACSATAKCALLVSFVSSIPLGRAATGALEQPTWLSPVAVVAALVAVLFTILSVRCVSCENHQVSVAVCEQSSTPEEEFALGELLSGAIKIDTVTWDKDNSDGNVADPSKLLDLHQYLEERFPLVL